MTENDAVDATIVVDDVGAVTLFVGEGTEPVLEDATNAEVIRALMRQVRDREQAMTVVTRYPSGHRTLHRFAPDGAVTALSATGAQAGAPPTAATAGAAVANGPAIRKWRRARKRSRAVGVAAILVVPLAATSSAGLLASGAGDEPTLEAKPSPPTSSVTRAPENAEGEPSRPAPAASRTAAPSTPTGSPTRTSVNQEPRDGTTAGEGSRTAGPGRGSSEAASLMQPGNLSVKGRTRDSITLSWAAATADLGVEGYLVYLDGKEVTSTPETKVTLDGLKAGTTYTLSVATCDVAGNVSELTAVKVKTKGT